MSEEMQYIIEILKTTGSFAGLFLLCWHVFVFFKTRKEAKQLTCLNNFKNIIIEKIIDPYILEQFVEAVLIVASLRLQQSSDDELKKSMKDFQYKKELISIKLTILSPINIKQVTRLKEFTDKVEDEICSTIVMAFISEKEKDCLQKKLEQISYTAIAIFIAQITELINTIDENAVKCIANQDLLDIDHNE